MPMVVIVAAAMEEKVVVMVKEREAGPVASDSASVRVEHKTSRRNCM